VFRYVLGSEGCVLVPRSSGTPVATWAWPTWVVSRRRVLEVLFILLEFPSPSRRIFIGSHSPPPLFWFAVSVLHRRGLRRLPTPRRRHLSVREEEEKQSRSADARGPPGGERVKVVGGRKAGGFFGPKCQMGWRFEQAE
jgi:hypothetical protein